MKEQIERIRQRLIQGAYPNEAAVTHGVVSPILAALGWDTTDPDQVMPEHGSGRGRVDFALLGIARRPSIFIEVKGVGRSIEGDRQLFEYAFHEGVPLCVLTDGREWSFYLPSGQGTYDDRRVYRLQIDDRDPSECQRVLVRYLDRERVKSGAAFDDAQRDYRDLASRRAARDVIPKAWTGLVEDREELLLELVAEKAEVLSGFRPSLDDVAQFLSLTLSDRPSHPRQQPRKTIVVPKVTEQPTFRRETAGSNVACDTSANKASSGRAVTYSVFGEARNAPNANIAFVDVLTSIAARHPEKMNELARAVQGRSRNHIARSPAEIYPARPDLARAVEIGSGWLVGLNIANREKLSITRTACDIFGYTFGSDIILELPNAH
jgi:predicted type IV restriction endonuclease